MIERYPSYYERFQCMAGACPDTCCAGWEIDIDDASYEAYCRIQGDFGERLRASIRSYESDPEGGYEEVYAGHGFILTDTMRCPFLKENGLCEIYSELGESALCEVCTNTPRNYLEYGGVREISVSASCPAAADLIYGSPEKICFSERESEEEADVVDQEELELSIFLKNARDDGIQILQNRSAPIEERVEDFLYHAGGVQDALNRYNAGWSSKELSEIRIPLPSDRKERGCCGSLYEDDDIYRNFLTRMNIYSGLASIGQPWADNITYLSDNFVADEAGGRIKYVNALNGLMCYMEEKERNYEYEHLLVYYAFMILNRSIDDLDYLTKAKFVVMSYEMNRDMDAGVFFRKGSFDKEDRKKNARIYAREVEHAEENLADIEEELLFL